MEQQEYIMRINMIQEEAGQIEKQIDIMDQQANELVQISKSLDDLWKNESPEFLANLGKGIFVKSKALEKELFVSVGKGIIVKKTPKETTEIIKDQLKRVSQTRSEFMLRLNDLQSEMQNLIEEAEKIENLGKHEHGCKCKNEEKCEDDCDCGEDCTCEEDKCKCKNKKR